jgi:hypothetical protein
MGAASAITSVLNVPLGLWANDVAGQQKKQELQFETNAERENARIADRAAQNSVERGVQAGTQSRLKYGALAGQQRAAYGAAGVNVNAGSAVDALSNTRNMSDYDAKVLSNNAAREAYGYRNAAKLHRKKSGMLGGAMNKVDEETAIKNASAFMGGVGGAIGGLAGGS